MFVFLFLIPPDVRLGCLFEILLFPDISLCHHKLPSWNSICCVSKILDYCVFIFLVSSITLISSLIVQWPIGYLVAYFLVFICLCFFAGFFFFPSYSWFLSVDPFWTLYATWTWMSVSFPMVGKFLAMISSHMCSATSSLSFPSGTPLMRMLVCLMFKRSLKRSSILFILVSFSVQHHWFPLFCLPAHWSIPLYI